MTGQPKTCDGSFWETFWDDKASEQTDFQATGRGGMDVPGFLYTVREVVRILELRPEDELVDIGCGTSIVALCLSPWLKRIHGIDVSSEMVARAKKNISDAENITVGLGTITDTGEQNACCDKVLAYSVLQYLPDIGSIEKAFGEISRILRPGGTALLAANPDPERRDALESVIMGKPDEQMRRMEQSLLERTSWFAREEILAAAEKAGLSGRFESIHPRIWQHFYMFDFVAQKHGS